MPSRLNTEENAEQAETPKWDLTGLAAARLSLDTPMTGRCALPVSNRRTKGDTADTPFRRETR